MKFVMTIFDDVVYKKFPVVVDAQQHRISDDDQQSLSSRQSNIEPVCRRKKHLIQLSQ